jgi:hypothetical protein
MMKYRVLHFLAASAAAFLCYPAFGADITAFVGGARPGSINIDSFQQSLDSGPVYGVRAAADFVPMLGHEHTLAFSSDYLFPKGSLSISQAKGFTYSSNLILNFPSRRIVPYATAGLGIIHQYGDKNLPVGTKFALNYGGGLKFPKILGPLGFRFDTRIYSAIGLGGSSLNMVEVTGGLLISLGN